MKIVKWSLKSASVCLAGLVCLVVSPWAAANGFGTIGPHKAHDLNPDPDVVEVVLVASVWYATLGTGNFVPVYTYNGSTPGPTIDADVGDRLIVHFFNYLPEETTIHWHGVELPANMDGSNIAQEAVPPGGKFTYEFDLLDASTFWYHPHIRSNEQVEKGLYGALVVHDPAEDQSLGLPEKEHVLILDDILLDEQGRIEEPFPADPVENAMTHVNGREGNTLLVNGRASPTRYIQRGVPHRLRIVNTANSRFMRVSIPGHTMWRIGGDGGLLETPVEIPPIDMVPDPAEPGELISNPDPSKGLLLTPGERADIVFTPTGQGPVEIEWHDIARGRHSATQNPDGTISLGHLHHDGHGDPQTLLTLELYGWGGGTAYVPPPVLRDIDPIDVSGAETIDVEFGHTQPTPAGDVTFFVQRKENVGQCPLPAGIPCPLPFPAVTPADAPTVEVGETRIIEVSNLTGGDHNFHLHGFFFQHLETQYVDMDNPDNNYTVPAERLEVKDTIHLPRRPGAMMRSKTITRLAVVFDDTGREGLTEAFGKVPGPTTSGGWVFHCHLLEHADNGMMSFVQVRNP